MRDARPRRAWWRPHWRRKGSPVRPRSSRAIRALFAGACPDPDPAAVLRDPAAPWQVHAVSVKPWPSCRHTHPVIDAALELSGMVDREAIEALDVATYQAAVDVCDRPMPSTPYEAKFSLQHCVAAAVADGEIGFASFESPARDAAAPLRAKVTVRAGEPYASAYPAAWGGEDDGDACGRCAHCRRPVPL